MFISRQDFAHIKLHICASNNSSQSHLENSDLDSAQIVTAGMATFQGQIKWYSFWSEWPTHGHKKLSRGRIYCLWQPAASQNFLIICSLRASKIEPAVCWEVPNLVGVGHVRIANCKLWENQGTRDNTASLIKVTNHIPLCHLNSTTEEEK